MTDNFLTLPDGTRYSGRIPLNEHGNPALATTTCGTCGFTWNDAMITHITPTPSGRCPNESNHRSTDPTRRTVSAKRQTPTDWDGISVCVSGQGHAAYVSRDGNDIGRVVGPDLDGYFYARLVTATFLEFVDAGHRKSFAAALALVVGYREEW